MTEGEFPEGSVVKVFGRVMFLREKIDQLIREVDKANGGRRLTFRWTPFYMLVL